MRVRVSKWLEPFGLKVRRIKEREREKGRLNYVMFGISLCFNLVKNEKCLKL